MTGIDEVLEQDDDTMLTCHTKKRIKTSGFSDISLTDSEINMKENDNSSQCLHHKISTSLDQPAEFESVKPCSFKSMSENNAISEEGIRLEVEENKLVEEYLDFEKHLSSNGEKVVIGKSNGITSENNCGETNTDDGLTTNIGSCEEDLTENKALEELRDLAKVIAEQNSDVDMSICMLPENDVIHKVASAETHTDDALITNKNEDISANKPSEETLQDEAKVIAEENSDKLTRLDDSRDFNSQVVNEGVNVDGCTRKKLLVLDVNGLLIDTCSYVPYDYDWDDIILKKAVFKRPYCDDFLKFCFERFNVGVWTSKTKRNMEPVLDFLLWKDKRKLLFSWDQSHCTHTGFNTVEKKHKPLLLKKLKKLWDKCEPDLPWDRGEYNESNTLLIDDSPYKALCNPRYSAIFPYTYRFRDVKDNALGPRGDLRVYLEGLAMSNNVQEYVKQNPFGQRPITEKNLSWGFYVKVIEASSSPPRETESERQTDNRETVACCSSVS